MSIIKWLDNKIEEVLLVILSTVMVSVIFFQVVMRVSGNSLSWSEELGRYCFIWLVYIGISYGVKKRRHIKVDVMLLVLKDKGKVILSMLANLLFLVFALLVVKHGNDIAMKLLGYGQKSPALQIPMGLVYMATPIGMGLTSIRLIQNLYDQFKMLIGKKDINTKTEQEKLQDQEDV